MVIMARSSEWLVNEMTCDHPGCERTDTTPCTFLIYQHDMSLFKVLIHYGLRQAWRIWRDGYIEMLDGYYCAEHAYEEGFCWTCGTFCAGSSERFDFRIGGQWLCDGCWDNFKSEFDDEDYDDEDYYPGPWDE